MRNATTTALVFLTLGFGAACDRDSIPLGPDVDMGGDQAQSADLARVACNAALGTPTALDTSSTSVWFTTLADFNGDGKLDVAVTNGGSGIGEPFPGVAGNTVSVMFGNGDGSFQPRTDYTTGD